MSLALSINVHNDAAALRGLLENGSQWADNIYVLDAGPGGARSNDGTIELCESFGISPKPADINEGFGRIRTRLIHECGCDWTVICDADERMFPALPMMRCSGSEKYPEVERPNLTVEHLKDLIYPGQHIKDLIQLPDIDAIKTIRRHWADFSMRHPCQNWEQHPDWQLRIVRNIAEIEYKSDVRMHEQIIDKRTGTTPRHFTAGELGGPHHDHFHIFFRRAFPGKKEANERYYDRLSRGEV